MPRPPGIIDRVNYVIDSWNNPCDLPWMVYVETALPAALEALIAVVCFDIADVVRFIFRPANLRSGRHGSRGKKGQHGRKPKGLRARLAVKLPEFSKLQQRKVSQGVRTLWVIDGIGQRLLWWWLVADVTTGFLYNFTSMIYKTEVCQMAAAPGSGLRQITNISFAAIIGWNSVSYPTLRYENGTLSWNNAAFSVGEGNWSVVASLECENTGASDQQIEIRIAIVRPSGTEYFTGGQLSLEVGGGGGLVMSMTAKGPFTGFVQMRPSVGFTRATDGDLYIQGRPLKPKPPIEYKCPIPFFT